MIGLQVIKPGPLSLIQDGGRSGWQHLGVSPGGPMDWQAAAWANRLVDNSWGSALLEVALGGVELECRASTWLALTGADAPVELDGSPLSAWSRFAVHPGQRLRIGFARSGQRLYLAAAGGFAVGGVLGSAATHVREGMGGLAGDGVALREGDVLTCAEASFPGVASVPWRYRLTSEAPLRVILGGDSADFAGEQLDAFFSRPWHLTPRSDRMGARLAGEGLVAPSREWSQGVARGAIQVPPDGQPIILQADRQTMGGYPTIGWLYPRDSWRLAQIPPNSPLRFARGNLIEAQAELRSFYNFFRR